MSRQKKYKMKAISSAFSEKGGYSAQFVSDGYTIDARKEILPDTIKENGIQVGEGVAWNLIQSFLKNCAARAASTLHTHRILMSPFFQMMFFCSVFFTHI